MQTNNVQNLKGKIKFILILFIFCKGYHSFLFYFYKEEIEDNIKDELKQLYISSSEILRHFHLCFPPKNNEFENKVIFFFF